MTAAAADFLDLPTHRVGVVLIDLQNDFCSPEVSPGRPPTNSANEKTAHRAHRFAAQAAALGAHVIYTRQVIASSRLTARQERWEATDGLCAAGSWGAELYLDPVPGAAVVEKNRFDCWQSRAFTDELDRHDIDGLVICGVELVCCVLYAILGASERGYHYQVPTDLVSGQDFGDSTDNQAVRDYLRHNRPERLTDAHTLLTAWRQQDSKTGTSGP